MPPLILLLLSRRFSWGALEYKQKHEKPKIPFLGFRSIAFQGPAFIHYQRNSCLIFLSLPPARATGPERWNPCLGQQSRRGAQPPGQLLRKTRRGSGCTLWGWTDLAWAAGGWSNELQTVPLLQSLGPGICLIFQKLLSSGYFSGGQTSEANKNDLI